MKMSKLKIVVVGNCQARPIAMALERLSDKIEVINVAIVHLLKNDQLEDYRVSFENADYIIAQLVAENYPCEFVRTTFLQKNYPEKIISIVNLYFEGYSPDWGYITKKSLVKLDSHIGGYHNKIIFACWKKGFTKSAAISAYENRFLIDFLNASEHSLSELYNREKLAAVKITEFIQSEWGNSKIFHTFNHPSGFVLIEYVKRILKYLGLNFSNALDESWDPLDRIKLPSVVGVPNSESCSALIHNESGSVKYDSRLLVENFYELYDKVKNEISFNPVFEKVNIRSKILDSSQEMISVEDRPEHPKVISDRLSTPAVYVERRTDVNVEFKPFPQFFENKDIDNCEIKRIGRVLDLSTPGAVVYTHWIFDLLPKFGIVEKSGLHLKDFDYLIVNNKNQDFQKNTLEKFLPDGLKVLTFPQTKGLIFHCEEHFYVTPVRQNLSTPRWVIDYIKQKFPPEVSSIRSRKLYLSRRNASRRKVVNEEMLIESLALEGFSIIDCEKFSVAQMVDMMSYAHVVVGPHGAGMANIAFCSRGTYIIEFYSAHLSQEYWLFAKRNSLNYVGVKCRNSENEYIDLNLLNYNKDFFNINSENIYVEISLLLDTLKKIDSDEL